MNYYLLTMFQLIISQTARERAKLAEHMSSLESDNNRFLEKQKKEDCKAIIKLNYLKMILNF